MVSLSLHAGPTQFQGDVGSLDEAESFFLSDDTQPELVQDGVATWVRGRSIPRTCMRNVALITLAVAAVCALGAMNALWRTRGSSSVNGVTEAMSGPKGAPADHTEFQAEYGYNCANTGRGQCSCNCDWMMQQGGFTNDDGTCCWSCCHGGDPMTFRDGANGGGLQNARYQVHRARAAYHRSLRRPRSLSWLWTVFAALLVLGCIVTAWAYWKKELCFKDKIFIPVVTPVVQKARSCTERTCDGAKNTFGCTGDRTCGCAACYNK